MADEQADRGWTRARLCAGAGISPHTLDTLERQHIAVPTVGRASGDTRPVSYDPVDAAVTVAAWRAYRLGVRGRELRRFADHLRARRDRLTPGWSGLVVYDGSGVDLLPHRFDAPVGSPALAVLVVPLVVEVGP
jgi:hypothetical protein